MRCSPGWAPTVPRSSRSATAGSRSARRSAGPARATSSLVAGKGHETGQEVDGVVHPFDDRDVVREELARPMIPMTLAEIAAVVGGEVDGDPTLTVIGPAFVDSRATVDGRAVRRRRGGARRRPRLRRGGVEAGAAAVLGSRPTGRPDGRGRRPGRRARPAGPARGRRDPADGARPDRLAGQDRHQGLPRPRPRGPRADRGHGRQPQQRDRRPAHRAAGRPRTHDLPRGGDGRPRHRPHRLPLRDRAAAGGRGDQRRHRPPRRVRDARGDRRGQGRDRRGAAASGRRRAQRRRRPDRGDGGPHRRPAC